MEVLPREAVGQIMRQGHSIREGERRAEDTAGGGAGAGGLTCCIHDGVVLCSGS